MSTNPFIYQVTFAFGKGSTGMHILIWNSNQRLAEFIQIIAEETVSGNYGNDRTRLEELSGASWLSPTQVL